MKVNLSEAFQSGDTNNSYFVDLPYMTESQKMLLFLFVQDVLQDKPLMGKNKESWLDDQRNTIPNTENYEANHYWHYHCGVYDPNVKIRSLTYQLKLNMDGLTSSAVIHYQKVSQDEITIVGFSPKHIPFPKEDDSNNPLFE